MEFKQNIIQIYILVFYVTTIPYDNQYGPGYGEEWLFFHNENGTHIMNFSVIPKDISDLIFGDAYYYLYTRSNVEPEELHVPIDNEEILTSQFFNSSNLVMVITHGWRDSEQSRWIQGIKKELLIKDDYNVITIDWYELSKNRIYPWSAFSTRYVGKKTARLLDAIARSYEIDGRNVHLVGHSLGAQVMAHTASFLSYRIHRITGLDPARPLFEIPMMPERCRLDKTDAEFVDIIHSSGGVLGYFHGHGHVDFYPNGGSPPQPGCDGPIYKFESCSHNRATLYFEESINPVNLFKAYPCESWSKFTEGECTINYTYMGLDAKIGDLGDRYLYTNAEPPFAIGDNVNNTEPETKMLDSK